MSDVLSTIDSYAELAEDWDSYHAHPIGAGAIAAAKALVQSVGAVPTTAGGVSIYLASEGVSVEFDAEGKCVTVWADLRDVTDYTAAVVARGLGEGK